MSREMSIKQTLAYLKGLLGEEVPERTLRYWRKRERFPAPDGKHPWNGRPFWFPATLDRWYESRFCYVTVDLSITQ